MSRNDFRSIGQYPDSDSEGSSDEELKFSSDAVDSGEEIVVDSDSDGELIDSTRSEAPVNLPPDIPTIVIRDIASRSRKRVTDSLDLPISDMVIDAERATSLTSSSDIPDASIGVRVDRDFKKARKASNPFSNLTPVGKVGR